MIKRYELLDFLRVFAILLVLNSHFDPLYPIPALASGGAIGNGLFFIISGYCLSFQPRFFSHMLRRIYRLYPGVLISVAIQLLFGFRSIAGIRDFVQQCIWPTAFWFVGALVLFDLFLYPLEKLNFRKHFGAFSVCMLVIYFIAYVIIVDKTVWSVEEPGLTTPAQHFKLIYYFYIYSLGYFIKKEKRLSNCAKYQKNILVFTGFSFVTSFAFKLFLSQWPIIMPFQFLSQFIVIGFSSCALLSSLHHENAYTQHVSKGLRRIISVFSSISLEMYLVQFPVIRIFTGFPFPVNVLLVLVTTTVLAFALNRLDNLLFRRLFRPHSQ